MIRLGNPTMLLLRHFDVGLKRPSYEVGDGVRTHETELEAQAAGVFIP